jgi:hypothetical protein
MKKYQCNACGIRICTAEYQNESREPFKCTGIFDMYYKPQWKEIVELPKLTKKVFDSPDYPERLPDWCKVGAWVFNAKVNKYIKVPQVDIEKYSVHVCVRISAGEILQARLRPYNAEEMKALVGKVIKNDKGSLIFVTGFRADDSCIFSGIEKFTADEIMRDLLHMDNKPCGALEHLENGEWVK